MLDGKQISKKLIGSEDERAVSPVIGVILMVAITVILAAVIAAFVLDLGDSVGQEAQAGIDFEESTSDGNVTVSVTSMGNSEEIVVRGDLAEHPADNTSGSVADGDDDENTPVMMNQTGQYAEFDVSGESGSAVVVGITSDGTETQVASESYDFS